VQKNIYEIDGKLKELGHFDQAERNVLKLLYRYNPPLSGLVTT
jgi:hypothetical protein